MRRSYFLAPITMVASTFLVLGCTSVPRQQETARPFEVRETPLQLPTFGERDNVLERAGFHVLFDPSKRVPRWVGFKLIRSTNSVKEVERDDVFKKDPDVDNCPGPNDYKGSGYDRGHLAPAEDMRWSKQAMLDSFYMSNMTPQSTKLNRGAWKSLETYLRNRMNQVDEIFVVAGPVLTEPCEAYIAVSICVPARHFKVYLERTGSEYRAMGFLMPQHPEKDYMTYAVSVDEVEKETGMDFFSALPDQIENSVESVVYERVP